LKKSALKFGLLVTGIGLIATVSLAVTSKPASTTNSSEGFYTTFFKYSSETGNIKPVGESPPVTAGLIRYGEWSYRGFCIGCHGTKADGNGAVWELADKYGQGHKLPRKPRDLPKQYSMCVLHLVDHYPRILICLALYLVAWLPMKICRHSSSYLNAIVGQLLLI